MKRKILLLAFFLLLVFSSIVTYRIKNINPFALYNIELPQEEKFDIEIFKIEKYKVWEMKNVYTNNGDYWFEERLGGKKIINHFYMVNKEVEDVDDFAAKFMLLMKPEYFSSNEIVIKYFFYCKSKKLPKYWKPVWDRHCIDELTQHKDDLLFVITTDAHKNILNVVVPFLEK